MKYYIFPFIFTSSVHFGNTSEGGSLDKVQLTISSDTFVSACVNEIGHNQAEIEWLLQSLRVDDIKISSLFPFTNLHNQIELFVPRPICEMQKKYISIIDKDTLLKRVKDQKKLKKIGYIRVSNLYNKVGAYSPFSTIEEPFFGQYLIAHRVALCEEKSNPYVVGSFKFAKNAGLYCIVGVKRIEDLDRVKRIFESLSYTGIGGKRSSGFGQFIVEDEFELDTIPAYGSDVVALYNLLQQKGSMYMSISAITPKIDEINIVSEGTYKLIKRSGFVYSESISAPYKRNFFYALQEGSCMPYPLEGQMVELRSDKSPHPIYKNMKGFWLGVNIDE